MYKILLLLIVAIGTSQAQTGGEQPQTTVSPSRYASFSAARTTSYTPTDNRVYFTTTFVNEGNYYDATTSTFIPNQYGYYWFHMSVGIDSTSQADAYMTGTDRVSNIVRGYTGYTGQDITSRDEIYELSTECGQVKVWSNYRVYSDTYLQTSFSGFSLGALTDSSPAVVFSFALSNPFTCPIAARVPFNDVILDTRNGWVASQYEYAVPVSGTYVISLTIGADPNDILAVGLYNYGALITGIQQASNDHNYESLGKTVVVNLNQYDRLYAACALYSNSYIYSETLSQTKLTGFLYAPQTFQPIAWSLANDQDLTGPVSSVTFPIVVVDSASGWDRLNNRYVVPVSGVYYISISTGFQGAEDTNMQLLINNTGRANVFMAATDHNNIKTRSRALVYRLAAGDQLRINLPSGYYMYSTDIRLTTFNGFRLHP